MLGGSTKAAGLRYGILPSAVVPILLWLQVQAGLINGIWPVVAPGAKLQRALLPAPKKFWPQLIQSGVPETYVWIPDTLQLPNTAFITGGILFSNAFPLPIGRS